MFSLPLLLASSCGVPSDHQALPYHHHKPPLHATHPSSNPGEGDEEQPRHRRHQPASFRDSFRPPQATISDATTTRRITTTSSTQRYCQLLNSPYSKICQSLCIVPVVCMRGVKIHSPRGLGGPGLVPGLTLKGFQRLGWKPSPDGFGLPAIWACSPAWR